MMGHAKRLASRRDFLKNTGRIATVSALASMAIPNVHAAGSDTPQSDAIEKHFLEAKKKREELRLLLEEAKNKGIDVSYPKVSWALNVLFERYIRRDLDRREYLKADYKVNSVLDSTNKAIDQIKEWIKDPSQQVRVPHISVNNLKIKDGEFCQGEEPVLLLGFVWAFPLDFVRSDFFLQSSLGFNSTEVCMGGLGLAEPDKEGELFAGWMDKLDACMKEAERNNIGVDLINQVASFASWVPETFPSIFTCSGSSDLPFCLTNPRTKELFKNYLQKIIPSIKDHPNLYSYCLVNEPRYQYAGYCSCCQKAFQDYLKGEYEDLGTLNKSWGTAYKTFREVGIPFEGRTSDSPSLSVFAYEKGALKEKVVANQHLILKPENLAPINNASMYDWQRFNQHRMAEFFTFMKGVVREADKKTAISWKSGWMTYAESGEDKGTDIEEIGRRSDVNNYDGPMSVALGGVWPSPGGNYAMNISTINGDLMKSLVPGKPIFNTEWHYVTHMGVPGVEGQLNFTPESYKLAYQRADPAYVRTAIWSAFLHGYSAGSLWDWASEHYSGYCALDLPRALESAGRTSLDLRRLTKEVTLFHKAPQEVAILFSMPSKLQNSAYLEQVKKFQSEGYDPGKIKAANSTSYSSPHVRELKSVYGGLYFVDTNYGFVSEQQIQEDHLAKYRLLIIPAADYVSDKTYRKIKDYVKDGGKVLIISSSLDHDERGNERDISELFQNGEDASLAGFPLRLSSLGKGEIYRMNSLAVNTDDSFPGQYLYIQEDQYRKFFQGFLDKTGVERTFRITGKGPIDGVEFRWVKSEDGYLAYLINYNKKKVTVTLQKRGKDIETAKELIGGNSISFPLEVKPLDPLLMKIER